MVEKLTEKISDEEKKISRRGLLVGAGKVAAGAAIVTAGMGLVSTAEASKAKFPWPYKKLDIDKVAKIAYENWFKNFCCYAVTSSILIPLREKVGEPYTSFPLMSTKWGHGGAVGWGTLCGSLTGAGIVTGLCAGHDGENILNEVIYWYADTALPMYKPANPKARIKSVNKSDSPLCHISVGKWMKKEGVKFFSPQRKDRCARLSADVAVQTVKFLNAWADGKFKPTHKFPLFGYGITAQENCTECHGSDVPQPLR